MNSPFSYIRRFLRRLRTMDYWKGKLYRLLSFDNLSSVLVQTDAACIALLLKERKTFIRWGDGEANLIIRGDLGFQEYDPDLRKELIQILAEYSEESNYIIGLPSRHICLGKKAFLAKPKGSQRLWKYSMVVYERYANKRMIYGDAFIFRPESEVSRGEINKLFRNKKVVIISSDATDRVNYELAHPDSKVIGHIVIPSKNAFRKVDEIFNDCLPILEPHNKSLDEIRIIIAAGPAGKSLAYRFSKLNYIAYDVGHYFKWKINEVS